MLNYIKQKDYNFKFLPDACIKCQGLCCNGEKGDIFVNSNDISAISTFLSIDSLQFINLYLRKISYKFSIVELKINNNYSCAFYDLKKNKCKIYPVRPKQCKTFPFWDYFRKNPEKIYNQCPGCFKL